MTPRVQALVLTYGAPDALRACLDALASQTRPPDDVLVIDNAGDPPARADAASVVRLERNLGPAGGHAEGLRRFLDGEADVAWVLDDDVVPEPGCLAALLEAASAASLGPVFPRQFTTDGRPDDHPRWAGVLLPRAAVAVAGLPMAELFWWVEDTEYLAHRLPARGFPSTTADAARVTHTGVRRTERAPDWKLYYESRNTIWYRFHVQRGRRAWKAARYLARVHGRVLRQPAPRGPRLRAVWRGVWDGTRGRLGTTVEPD